MVFEDWAIILLASSLHPPFVLDKIVFEEGPVLLVDQTTERRAAAIRNDQDTRETNRVTRRSVGFSFDDASLSTFA